MNNLKWAFYAYKTKIDYQFGNHYFTKTFNNHSELKRFSSEHSKKEKKKYPNYCSMYCKVKS